MIRIILRRIDISVHLHIAVKFNLADPVLMAPRIPVKALDRSPNRHRGIIRDLCRCNDSFPVSYFRQLPEGLHSVESSVPVFSLDHYSSACRIPGIHIQDISLISETVRPAHRKPVLGILKCRDLIVCFSQDKSRIRLIRLLVYRDSIRI